MREVVLYGHLAKKFGKRHFFDVNSPAEAVRALCANFKDFQKAVTSDNSIGYQVVNGDTDSDVKELHYPASGKIKIIPRVFGSSGTAKLLIGVVLIAAAVVFSPFLGAAAPYVMNIGIALALGGIVQLLSPPPKINEPAERPENKPSYLFNGPVNTTAQGHPVPLAYGRLRVGSAIVSAGISVEQIPANIATVDLVSKNDAVASNAPRFYFNRELLSTVPVYSVVTRVNPTPNFLYNNTTYRYYYYA